jgi:tetraacyldisaccharide 4'-kinase
VTSPSTLAILTRQDNSLRARFARLSLAALRPGYAMATAMRNAAFDHRLRTIHRLDRPVISVGNLTTGGTGKTPIVINLARRLIELGASPAVLLRGYRAEPRQDIRSSDETKVLRGALGPDVPIEPDPDRVAAAQRVVLTYPQTDVFLLDDGFQHRRLHRDLDLVLVDATRPFGCVWPLPASYRKSAQLPLGLLRESPRNLRRAGGVIITRADQTDGDQLARLDALVEILSGRPPLAHAAHRWTGLLDAHDQLASLETLKNLAIAAVCGIANAQPFLDAARAAAARLALACPLRDHQPYDHKLLGDILEQASASGAQALLMTEKDWVKCKPLLHKFRNPPLPIYRPVLDIAWLRGQEAVGELLAKLFRREPR